MALGIIHLESRMAWNFSPDGDSLLSSIKFRIARRD
jgi:hypothetical protein